MARNSKQTKKTTSTATPSGGPHARRPPPDVTSAGDERNPCPSSRRLASDEVEAGSGPQQVPERFVQRATYPRCPGQTQDAETRVAGWRLALCLALCSRPAATAACAAERAGGVGSWEASGGRLERR